jgi:hypothetical protein
MVSTAHLHQLSRQLAAGSPRELRGQKRLEEIAPNHPLRKSKNSSSYPTLGS